MTDPAPGPQLADHPRPRTSRPVRLCVVADPHVVADGHGTWKQAHRSEELFRRALATAERLDPALTLLAGDLTGDGRPASFDVVDGLLADFERPWVAVPGNHDVPKAFDDHDPPTRTFQARYTDLPTVVEAGPVSVLAVNSASARGGSLAATWGGRVGRRDRAWLDERLARTETPVVLVHHNVGALPDAPGGKYRNFQLQDAERVRALLAEHGVPLVCSGHHHVPALLDHGTTVELLAPAVCSYPLAMLSVDVGPTGTTVHLVPLGDREDVAAARAAAVSGKPLARGIATMVDRRLDGLSVDRDTDG